jgi:hypothetical protein
MHESWNATCKPGMTVADTQSSACEGTNRHVYFACQTGGLGLHGETLSGCGQVGAAATTLPAPSPTPPLPNTTSLGAVEVRPQVLWGLPLAAIAAGLFAIARRRRRSA